MSKKEGLTTKDQGRRMQYCSGVAEPWASFVTLIGRLAIQRETIPRQHCLKSRSV
jgi:hypothetical protein